MSYPESEEEFDDKYCSYVASVFRRYRKDVPPANILEEISHKIRQADLLTDFGEIYLAYGLDTRPKKEKDVPFIKFHDVIRQALSGSGKKSETFCTGILQHLDCSLAECQALILAPTRQLAQQIAEVMRNLGDNVGVKVHTCVGGEKCNFRKDRRVLSQGGCHVIVGTPGRLCTVLKRKLLQPDHIKMFVLDDADEMLLLGFRNQIKEIFRFLPSKVQLTLFSATLHPEALKIMRKLMLKPVRLLSKSREVEAQEGGIKKFYVNVPNELKFATLCHICETLDMGRCVIYAHTKCDVLLLGTQMSLRGYKVSAAVCTGTDKFVAQKVYDTELVKFRSGYSNVLITMPGLIVRALDLQQVSLVINYDLPPWSNNYHRFWRGGRFGRDGVVIDVVTMNDEELAAAADIHGFCDVVTVEGAGLR